MNSEESSPFEGSDSISNEASLDIAFNTSKPIRVTSATSSSIIFTS